MLNGSEIHWVEKTDYLGITICSAGNFKCNCSDAKRQFYCCSNTIFGRLGASCEPNAHVVVLKLINATALQKLLYGTVATTLNKSDLIEFNRVYYSIFSKIFKTFDKSILRECQYHFGYLSFTHQYHLHCITFMQKLCNSNLKLSGFCC